MNPKRTYDPVQDALERADKDAWREREGWCSPAEVANILSPENGPIFELVEPEIETVP